MTKVTLYNQVLQRYNVLSDKHVKEPVRVVAVNESEAGARAGVTVAVGTYNNTPTVASAWLRHR